MYYLSWLRNRILHNDPEVEKKQGWITVGELEGCVHYKVGRSCCGCERGGFIGVCGLCESALLILYLFSCLALVKYERIKFLVIALKNAVEIYAWAPKPYHKFMAFKVRLTHTNTHTHTVLRLWINWSRHRYILS